LSAAIVEELEPVWVCCGWPTPPTTHSTRIHVYWNIVTMHGPINVKSPNNTSKWQIGFNSSFKELTEWTWSLGHWRLCKSRQGAILPMVAVRTGESVNITGVGSV
jgi:hypothetical protein